MKTNNNQSSTVSPRLLLRKSLFGVLGLLLISFAQVSGTERSNSERFGLHRLLLFKFTEDATQAQINDFQRTFNSLREKVEGMNEVIWANDHQFDGSRDFTHVAILSFDSEAAIKAYEEHPEHKALAISAPPIVANFFELNYETNASNVSRTNPSR